MSGAPFDLDAMLAAGRADAPDAARRARLREGLRARVSALPWRGPAALAGGAGVLLAALLLWRQAPVPAAHLELPRVAVVRAAPTASSLAEEARLLREAQRALDRGDAAAAHAALDAHASRFPAGLLAPERHAALALTACLEQQPEVARREADALAALAPGSPLRARLEASCASSHETREHRPLTGPP